MYVHMYCLQKTVCYQKSCTMLQLFVICVINLPELLENRLFLKCCREIVELAWSVEDTAKN
jgi:hypothetical protein